MAASTEFDRLWAAGLECHGRGDDEGAIVALRRAVSERPAEMRPLGMLCRLLYENPSLFVPSDGAELPQSRELVSVVTCSIDAEKFERAKASYARAFATTPWELIGIHDARSLAEGYARGFAMAKGSAIVFAHDDIEILSGDLGGALTRSFAEADVVGVVGTTKLAGPAFAWSGKANARGRIAEPARGREGVELVIFNPVEGLAHGIEALDGVFMAARREAVEKVGFDAVTFDGFHLYDVDFSYRARLAGLRVAVTPDIILRHDSPGSFDSRWQDYAGRFLAKFPGVLGERKPNDMLRIPFPGPDELVAYCRRLDEAGRRALAGA